MGGAPTVDECCCFVIQIPDPDSAHNCLCWAKQVIWAVAEGADDETVARSQSLNTSLTERDQSNQ